MHVRHALWVRQAGTMPLSSCWRNRADEHKRIGWEMLVRIEKIICTVPNETHQQQVEETMETLSEGPEGLYK